MTLYQTVFGGRRWSIVIAIACSILTGVSTSLLLGQVTRLMNQPASVRSETFAAYLALTLAVVVGGLVPPLIVARLSHQAAVALRVRLTRQILDAPLATLERLTAPRLITAIGDDIQAIAAAAPTVPSVLVYVTVILGCLAFLGWTSLVVLGTTLAALLVCLGIQQSVIARGTRRLSQAREIRDVLLRDLHALINGVKELKLHLPRQEDFLSTDVHPALEHHRHHLVASSDAFTIANAGVVFVVYGYVAFLLFGAMPLIGIAAAEMRATLFTLFFMIAPLSGVVASIPTLARARIGWKRIIELETALAVDGESADANGAPAPPREPIAIELRGIVHTYTRENEDGRFTLGPVNLTLRAGEIVFLVGGNGSGKTTLAKVLTGLYTPISGSILCGGTPITARNRAAYSQLFSSVFSDGFVFERFFGLAGAETSERALEYLERLRLTRAVDVRADRLTPARLSGGQRQRLALLTAYLEDRPAFVFDEWASNQDPEFRRVFYETLLPELRARGKAVLAITHDDRYFGVADRILKLDAGQPVPADALAAAVPAYAAATQ